MRVNPPDYQNNPNWAIHNKRKGLLATCLSTGSAIAGTVKACSSEDSKSYKISNFLEKLCYSVSNFIQYLLFSRDDDVLGDDKRNNSLACNVGKVASVIEKVNPIIKPASTLLDANLQEGLNDSCNFFDSFYWKIRFACEQINFKDFKLIPNFIKNIFSKEIKIEEKKNMTNEIAKIITPLLASVGALCIGAFTPVKIVLKLIDGDSKIINALAAVGKFAINIPYFFKFTLPILWQALITKDKKAHLAFSVGATANAMNVALPLIEVLPDSNNFLIKFCKTWKSLASNLGMIFFPLRRNYLGENWIETNQLKN